jgi:hypothetical protein
MVNRMVDRVRRRLLLLALRLLTTPLLLRCGISWPLRPLLQKAANEQLAIIDKLMAAEAAEALRDHTE